MREQTTGKLAGADARYLHREGQLPREVIRGSPHMATAFVTRQVGRMHAGTVHAQV
jgi:hypothetical protein